MEAGRLGGLKTGKDASVASRWSGFAIVVKILLDTNGLLMETVTVRERLPIA